jgi:LuxR family maltose regulon positive regulatory protein
VTNPLLATKLYVPPMRGDWVARPRLLERLHSGTQHELTLISAPAGFGKTTLLREWTAEYKDPLAWLSLDVADNDPVRFWRYCIAALDTVLPEIGPQLLPMLQAPQPPTMEPVLTVFINSFVDVLRRHGPSQLSYTLVLDDYHLIEAQTIHDALTFLLDHLPPLLHLVIASRSDPPLPLTRLRARGELIELRASDLRFTLAETTAFLNRTMRLHLPVGDVAALSERTEGWIVGLQLAAISIQGQADAAGFISAFTGSHRFVLDYLIEEVLERQPENVQAFLLQTSILERLSGSLCNALTGRQDGHMMLEQLERSNLFIVPLDAERRWYRYHHLFADLLRYRLQRTQAERVAELQRRASQWYAHSGLMTEAIHHALAAAQSSGEFEPAAGLIEAAGEATWMRGEVRTLLGWLGALPDMIVRAHARLCLLYAWTHVLEGQIEPARQRWQDAQKVADPVSDEEQGLLAAIGAAVAYLPGDAARSIELSKLALQRLPRDNTVWRGMTMTNLGIAYRLAGDIDSAARLFAESVPMHQAAGNWHAMLMATIDVGDTYQIRGQLRRAADLYQEGLDSATARGAGRLPLTAEPLVRMGRLRYEWNDLGAAGRHLTEGIERAQPLENMRALGYLGIALVLHAQANPAGALAMMEEAAILARSQNATIRTIADVGAYQVRLWLMQGNIAAAAQWADQFRSRLENGSERTTKAPIWHEMLQIASARVLIAQEHSVEALGLLARLLQAAEAGGRAGHVIEIRALQALALQAQGDIAEAHKTLSRSLLPAEPEGYMRTYIDEGEPMARLLQSLMTKISIAEESRRLKDYAGKLLAAMDRAAIPPPWPVEPLSERELEVLRLLASGHSNREIAKALIVTVGTVKTHIHNIYGKLNVQSRTQAIARARELALL